MRKLSIKAKAANAIAAAEAHAKQVMLLNERLQASNAAMMSENAKLHDTIMVHAKARDKAEASIAAFKEEALQSAVALAEMRGYIARVLEDDTVREVGGAKQEPAVMADTERSSIEQMLHADSHARRQPPRSVRRGPTVMNPAFASSAWDNFQWSSREMVGMAGADTRRSPTDWLNR